MSTRRPCGQRQPCSKETLSAAARAGTANAAADAPDIADAAANNINTAATLGPSLTLVLTLRPILLL